MPFLNLVFAVRRVARFRPDILPVPGPETGEVAPARIAPPAVGAKGQFERSPAADVVILRIPGGQVHPVAARALCPPQFADPERTRQESSRAIVASCGLEPDH